MDAALDEVPRPTENAAIADPGLLEHGPFLNKIDAIVIAPGDTGGKLEVSLILTCATWMVALTRSDS